MTVTKRCFNNWLIITLLLSFFTFSACSWRTMYGYLDLILPWYLDDYVTLTEQQEKLFDRTTMQFLDWHRSVELPRYADFFSTLKDAQGSPMSQEQVLFFFDKAERLWIALLEESIPDLLDIARQLSENQVEQIDKALQADIEKLKEKYGRRTEIEQREFWKDKMSDGVNDWLGYMDKIQRDIVERWSQSRINTAASWLSYRNNWRERFIQILDARNHENFDTEMTRFLLQPQNIYSGLYLQDVTENRMGFAGAIAEISSTLTDEQRAYLQKELAEIMYDLHVLSGLEG